MSTNHDLLVQLLAQALGETAAREVVVDVAMKEGISLSDLDRDGAMQILELIAMREGLIGITARFAKSRAMLLQWA